MYLSLSLSHCRCRCRRLAWPRQVWASRPDQPSPDPTRLRQLYRGLGHEPRGQIEGRGRAPPGRERARLEGSGERWPAGPARWRSPLATPSPRRRPQAGHRWRPGGPSLAGPAGLSREAHGEQNSCGYDATAVGFGEAAPPPPGGPAAAQPAESSRWFTLAASLLQNERGREKKIFPPFRLANNFLCFRFPLALSASLGAGWPPPLV